MNDQAGSRHCPICGSSVRELLFRQDFATIDEGSPVNGYDVVVCANCGAAYADGIPEQAAFDRYYRLMSKYEYAHRGGEESDFDRRRLTAIAEVIAPHVLSPNHRILDIGCSNGRLLAVLRDRGFRNVVGLDPSPACSAAAASLYQIDAYTMTLSELAATGEQFDFVIMIGVLEHLRDLAAAFDDIHAIQKPGGRLYVEVPDATAFADWPNAPYQDFSTEHINFFSPGSLDNLMRRHGFKCLFLEQNHREQSYKTIMSNVSAVYERQDVDGTTDVHYDHESAEALRRYIARSAADDARLRAVIDVVVNEDRPIIVWGVGTHTSRLLATSRLREARIVAFMESNPRYHGKTFLGRPILAPAMLKAQREPVLVSSRVFQQEIVEQIRHELDCPNDLILLYDV